MVAPHGVGPFFVGVGSHTYTRRGFKDAATLAVKEANAGRLTKVFRQWSVPDANGGPGVLTMWSGGSWRYYTLTKRESSILRTIETRDAIRRQRERDARVRRD